MVHQFASNQEAAGLVPIPIAISWNKDSLSFVLANEELQMEIPVPLLLTQKSIASVGQSMWIPDLNPGQKWIHQCQ